MNTLLFEYDPETDVATVEGIRYTGTFFRLFAENGLMVGSGFRVVCREDGAITVQRLPEHDWDMPEPGSAPLPCPICGLDDCEWMAARLEGRPLDFHRRTISGTVRHPESLGPHLLLGDAATGGLKPVPLYDGAIAQGREIQRRLVAASARPQAAAGAVPGADTVASSEAPQ